MYFCLVTDQSCSLRLQRLDHWPRTYEWLTGRMSASRKDPNTTVGAADFYPFRGDGPPKWALAMHMDAYGIINLVKMEQEP